jgi:SET domain-containing protein
MVMGFGYAGIYNHSSQPNVMWESDEENRLLVFSTTRDVMSGEELFTYYGDDYDWNSIPINQ